MFRAALFAGLISTLFSGPVAAADPDERKWFFQGLERCLTLFETGSLSSFSGWSLNEVWWGPETTDGHRHWVATPHEAAVRFDVRMIETSGVMSCASRFRSALRASEVRGEIQGWLIEASAAGRIRLDGIRPDENGTAARICPIGERAGVLMVQRDVEGGVRFVLYRGANTFARC